MRERLILDPIPESPSPDILLNAPLEITSPDDDYIVGLVAHAYPMPQVGLQTSSSVDTDGEEVGSSRYSNREIPITVEIVDPGLPAAENLIPNPAPNVNTTQWGPSVSGGGTTNVFEIAEMPDHPGEGALHYNGTQPADTTTRGYGVSQSVYSPVEEGVEYIVGFDAYVANTAQGGTNGWRADVVWYEADGTTVVSQSSGTIVNENVGARDVIRETFTAPATAAFGRLLARQITNVSGDVLGAYYTRFLFVESTAGPTYFDGDTPGCYWSTYRYAGTSIRREGTDRLEAAISDIEAKVAKLNREGGTLRRELVSGNAITFDVVAATGFDVTFDKPYDFGIAQVSFTLQAKPYGSGDLTTIATESETSAPYLEFMTMGVLGTVDPFATLTIDNNDASAAQNVVLIGTDSNGGWLVYYDAANNMDPNTSVSTLTTGTAGAFGAGSNVIKSVSGVNSTNEILATVEDVQNIGTYRAFARVRATAADATLHLLVKSRTREVTLPATTWGLADFGLVQFRSRFDEPLSDIHVIGRSTSATTDVEINWLLLLPANFGYSELYGPIPADMSGRVARESIVITDGTTNYDPIKYLGPYPKLRAAGLEAAFMQTVIKACAGDRDGYFIEDPAADDIAATYSYRPRYLVVPRPE